jgi:outer membrane phospholipase A
MMSTRRLPLVMGAWLLLAASLVSGAHASCNDDELRLFGHCVEEPRQAASAASAGEDRAPNVRPTLPAISAYKDNFFDPITKRWGSDRPVPVMFRFGLKAPIWVTGKGNGVFVTYRMTGLWDIDSPSAPFRDINHNPALTWVQVTNDIKAIADSWTGFEAGIEHISNGQDNTSTGPNGTGTMRSRSIDAALFFEPKFQWSVPVVGLLRYQPRLWVPVGTDENPGIRHEWGMLWNTLSVGDHAELSTKGNPFSKGQTSLKVFLDVDELRGKGRSVVRLGLTVFNGYGDGLLDYDKRHTWVRLGAAFRAYSE